MNREVPAHAAEMWSAIDLLATTVENTRCAVDESVGRLSSAREYLQYLTPLDPKSENDEEI